jgi:GntR family transcriptional regulator
MEFKEKQAIYIQIADFVCEQILINRYSENEKIPSIRELAVQLEVNPNTVQRSYDFLQQNEIISTKRGLGYFVEEGAMAKIKVLKKQQFLENELPEVFKNMFLLNINFDDLQIKYSQFLNEMNNEK